MRPSSDCRLCGLCRGRTNLVLPSGNPCSKVAFVGEAPGENEDLQGKPFVGRSGKILDEMMEGAGISRSDIIITNTVKCRPPDNRDPTKEEMSACRPFLDYELKDCSFIVGLGKSACRDLIGYEGKMANIVNSLQIIFIGGREIPFLPTYHPAACIYSREAKEGLSATMKKVSEHMSKGEWWD